MNVYPAQAVAGMAQVSNLKGDFFGLRWYAGIRMNDARHFNTLAENEHYWASTSSNVEGPEQFLFEIVEKVLGISPTAAATGGTSPTGRIRGM